MPEGLEFVEVVKELPFLSLPVRTTVVQLGDARLLISPASALTPAQLRELGPISDLVAPSLLHAAGMPAAIAAFPAARRWGPVGAREKLRDIAWTHLLGVDAWPYEAELARVSIDGMPKINESVFLHRASRSLIVTDLAFNLVDAKGPGAWLFLHLFGTWRRFAVSRLFLSLLRDKSAFRASVQRIAALDFDNVAPGHGALVLGDAKSQLLEALRERGYFA